MNWLEYIISAIRKIPSIYNWIKYRKYINIVKSLDSYGKNIVNGLRDSPVPLQLYQAYKKSTGGGMLGGDLFLVRNESIANDLVEKKLILKIENGYCLTKEAEYAISKGALKISR